MRARRFTDHSRAALTTEPEQTFSDLVAFGRHSLAWVRIYRRGPDEAVALALNPNDAGGAGVINDAEALLETLRRMFPNLPELRLFSASPKTPTSPGGSSQPYLKLPHGRDQIVREGPRRRWWPWVGMPVYPE